MIRKNWCLLTLSHLSVALLILFFVKQDEYIRMCSPRSFKTVLRNENVFKAASFTRPSVTLATGIPHKEVMQSVLSSGVVIHTGCAPTEIEAVSQALQQFDSLLICLDSFTGSYTQQISQPDFFVKDTVAEGAVGAMLKDEVAHVRAGIEKYILPYQVEPIIGLRVLEHHLDVAVDAVFLNHATFEHEMYIEIELAWKLLRQGGILYGANYEKIKYDLEQFMDTNSFPDQIEAWDMPHHKSKIGEPLFVKGDFWYMKKGEEGSHTR